MTKSPMTKTTAVDDWHRDARESRHRAGDPRPHAGPAAARRGAGERYLRLKCGLPSYKGQFDREHAALLNAVRRRDVPRAQSLVSKHLIDTGELLYRVLSEDANAHVP